MVFNSITWPEDFEAEPPLTQCTSMEVGEQDRKWQKPHQTSYWLGNPWQFLRSSALPSLFVQWDNISTYLVGFVGRVNEVIWH